MPRRGENIYKRKDGRWEGRYIKSRTSEGKAKYGYVYAESYKNAKEKLKEAICHCDINKITKSCDIRSWFTQWLIIKNFNIKEATYSRYKRIVDNYIVPVFGSRQIESITTDDVKEYVNKLLTNGKSNGQGGLSPKTVSDIYFVFKSAMMYADDSGYKLNCNLRSIIIKKRIREMRVLTYDEQDILSNYLREDINLKKLGVLICLYTGIRIGELCALRWENIQLSSRCLCIRETLQRIPSIGSECKTKIIITAPKTTCSIRNIPIPEFLLPLLFKFQTSPKSYVLTGESDRFVEPRIMQYYFQKCIQEAGIAKVNFHSLRHTFATRCIEAGFETKSLSEILGHSSVNITLDKYVHSSFQLKEENMNKLNF